MTQCVPPPWPELRCANERTRAILSATLAILLKSPPISTPGRFVFTAPLTERNSAGADIFGSNVSMWVGPPPSHNQTTDVFFVGLPLCAARARARSRSGKARPPRPRAPTRKKSRRVAPSQLVPLRDASAVNMEKVLPLVGPATPSRERRVKGGKVPAVGGQGSPGWVEDSKSTLRAGEPDVKPKPAFGRELRNQTDTLPGCGVARYSAHVVWGDHRQWRGHPRTER